MEIARLWWRFVRAAGTWRLKLLVVLSRLAALLMLLALLYALASFAVRLGAAGLSAAALFMRRLFWWLLDAMPLIVLLVVLTYLMGKPGKTIRKGTVGLINNVLIGVLGLLGVSVEGDGKKKREVDEDDD